MATDIKRLHYFNGQFMREPDFTAEQEYHMEMRRRHNNLLHTWGIAKGLALSFAAGASVVSVSEGIAVDAQGREIVLANDIDTSDLTAYQGKTVYLTIAYGEQETDPTNEAGVSGNTRWTEKPLIEVSEDAPVSGDVGVKLILGRVTLDSGGKVTGTDDGVDPNKRRAAGVVGGDLQVNGLTLADPNVVPGQWVKMSLGSAGRADVAGSLKVTGSIEVGADVTVNGILHGTNIVGEAQIAANAVTAAKIADGTVGTAELANNAVTSAKLQSDASVDANRAVTTNHIRDNAITAAKIADGTVGTAELANNAVTAAKIADGTVGTAELANDAVTSAKLQSDAANDVNRAVTTDHIRDGAVTINKLASTARPASIEGVSNPGGNIDLAQANAIVITPDSVNKRITIGETHSGTTGNPHGTTAAQVGALPSTGGTLTGNLGINTAPSDALDVNGDVRVRGADIKDAGGTARITLTDNGNLELKEDGGTSILSINVDGKVGIRCTDKLANLTVRSSYGYKPGTVSVSSGSTEVVGVGTTFLTHAGLGDYLFVNGGGYRHITAITSDTSLTVDSAFTTALSGVTWWVHSALFRADYYDGIPKFFVSHEGRVGIGTISPGADFLDVQGRCYSSGGWQTTNADYAEYFESTDGDPIPVATPVVLANGGKVRAAKKGEVPIGIATENSAVVGNSYKEWPQKYLRDKFGRVIMEKVKEEIQIPKRTKVKKERQKMKRETVTEEVSRPEIVLERGKYVRREKTEKVEREVETPLFREVDLFDSDGKTVIGKHQVPLLESYEEEIDVLDEKGEAVLVGTGEYTVIERPKINPKHNEKKSYIPRGERQEWVCVGLLGQLPLRKGKVVAPTWIKIKDLADDVELWLVK